MLEMKVTIAPTAELAAALEKLATAIGGVESAKLKPTAAPTPSPSVPGVPSSAIPAQTAAPVAQTVPAAAPASAVAPAADAASASVVPTAAPQYTLEMISNAGTSLVDAGKMAELLQLLAKHGVNALTELKPEAYGGIAAELRALGATI